MFGNMRICLFLIAVKMAVSSGSHYRHEAQLHRELLSTEYNSEVRPADESDNPVKVKVHPSLIRIDNINEDRGLMETTISLSMSWTDSRLTWHPVDYGGITQTHMTLEKLWKPDIGLSNGLPDARDVVTRSVMAVVSSSGTVAAVLMIQSQSYCDLNLMKFPFDKQTCDIKLASWIYSSRQMVMEFWFDNIKHRLTLSVPDMAKTDRLWTMETDSVTASIQNVTNSCCPDDPYIQLKIEIPIARQSTYLSNVLIAQLVIFLGLLPLLFVLPPTSSDRTVLGILILIGDILQVHTLVQNIPSQFSPVPIIGRLYIANLCAGFIALLLSSSVVWAARQPRNRQMSVLTQKVLLRLRQLFCHHKAADHRHVNGKKLITEDDEDFTSELDTELQAFHEIHEQDDSSSETIPSPTGKVKHVSDKEPKSHTPAFNMGSSVIAKYLVETNRLLRDLKEKVEAYGERQGCDDKWAELAALLDKLFTILFSLLALVMVIILLCVALT